MNAYSATLYITLKGHKGPVNVTRTESSHKECAREVDTGKEYDIGHFQSIESSASYFKPIQLILTKAIAKNVHKDIIVA